MSTSQSEGLARLNRVYEQYVKPVEHLHTDEYVMVGPDGEMIFGSTLLDIAWKAHEVAHPDNCLFKVGEISAVQLHCSHGPPYLNELLKLVEAADLLSEPSLVAVWDNPEDDVYNER
jgi:hypothetical protein